jgi:hypothetical protein
VDFCIVPVCSSSNNSTRFLFSRERIDTTGYERHEWMDVTGKVYMGCVVLEGIVEGNIVVGRARAWD